MRPHPLPECRRDRVRRRARCADVSAEPDGTPSAPERPVVGPRLWAALRDGLRWLGGDDTGDEDAAAAGPGPLDRIGKAWAGFLNSPPTSTEPVAPAPRPLSLWDRRKYSLTPLGGSLLSLSLVSWLVLQGSTRQYFVLAVFLAGAWLVALLVARSIDPGMEVKAIHPARARAGDRISLRLEVSGARGRYHVPVTVRRIGVDARFRPGLEPEVEVAGGGAGEVTCASIEVPCPRRGVMTWGGFLTETSFPLGLIRRRRTIEQPSEVLVYPSFAPLEQLGLRGSLRYQPGGLALTSELGEGLEYIGNRPYRVGDSIRRLDWRATARTGEPVVREFREEYFLRVGVVLDTAAPQARSPAEEFDFEQAVSLCASVCDYLSRSDFVVDLYLGGSGERRLMTGRSLAHLDQVLEALAYVEQDGPRNYDDLARDLAMEGTQLTTVVCIFTDWSAERAGLAEELRQRGLEVRCLVVRSRPCTVAPPEGRDGPTVVRSADRAREL